MKGPTAVCCATRSSVPTKRSIATSGIIHQRRCSHRNPNREPMIDIRPRKLDSRFLMETATILHRLRQEAMPQDQGIQT